MRAWRARVAAALIVAWAAWLAVSPLAAAQASQSWILWSVAATYRAGRLICHQQPGRSPRVGGVQTAVCARCLGLYEGAAAGAAAGLVWARRRSDARTGARQRLAAVKWLLAGSAVPTVALWLAEHAAGVGVGNAIRFAGGLPLGAAAAAFVVAWAGGVPFDDTTRDSAVD